MISCSKDKRIKIFDLVNEMLVQTLSSHVQTVTSIAYTPDQNYLFSTGDDKKVILWST